MSFCTGLAGFLVLCSWTGVLIRMNTGSGSATCTGFRTKLLRERFAYRLHNLYIYQDARQHPLVFCWLLPTFHQSQILSSHRLLSGIRTISVRLFSSTTSAANAVSCQMLTDVMVAVESLLITESGRLPTTLIWGLSKISRPPAVI